MSGLTPRVFQENRAVVASIVWSLDTFTLDSVLEEYHKKLGSDRCLYLGQGQSVFDYIEDLCYSGVLSESPSNVYTNKLKKEYEAGNYKV